MSCDLSEMDVLRKSRLKSAVRNEATEAFIKSVACEQGEGREFFVQKITGSLTGAPKAVSRKSKSQPSWA